MHRERVLLYSHLSYCKVFGCLKPHLYFFSENIYISMKRNNSTSQHQYLTTPVLHNITTPILQNTSTWQHYVSKCSKKPLVIVYIYYKAYQTLKNMLHVHKPRTDLTQDNLNILHSWAMEDIQQLIKENTSSCTSTYNLKLFKHHISASLMSPCNLVKILVGADLFRSMFSLALSQSPW